MGSANSKSGSIPAQGVSIYNAPPGMRIRQHSSMNGNNPFFKCSTRWTAEIFKIELSSNGKGKHQGHEQHPRSDKVLNHSICGPFLWCSHGNHNLKLKFSFIFSFNTRPRPNRPTPPPAPPPPPPRTPPRPTAPRFCVLQFYYFSYFCHPIKPVVNHSTCLIQSLRSLR